MAEALEVSKRYYEQLKQKTYDQKQDEDKVNIGCASLVQYLKSELQADVEHDWNASLEWFRDQAKYPQLRRAPKELPESSHLQALVKYVS